jgi:hypothetical protein
MHTHGTAVLPEATETISANTSGASARDQWLAKSTEDAAKALATGNAALLPLLPELVFCPRPATVPGLRRYRLHVDGRGVHPLPLHGR